MCFELNQECLLSPLEIAQKHEDLEWFFDLMSAEEEAEDRDDWLENDDVMADTYETMGL